MQCMIGSPCSEGGKQPPAVPPRFNGDIRGHPDGDVQRVPMMYGEEPLQESPQEPRGSPDPRSPNGSYASLKGAPQQGR